MTANRGALAELTATERFRAAINTLRPIAGTELLRDLLEPAWSAFIHATAQTWPEFVDHFIPAPLPTTYGDNGIFQCRRNPSGTWEARAVSAGSNATWLGLHEYRANKDVIGAANVVAKKLGIAVWE